MTRVRFFRADGSFDREVDAPAGANLLDLAQAAGQPLEGACEGVMSCSTCHVLIGRAQFDRLAPAGVEEDDLLDFAAHVGPTSRLACQVAIPEGLDQLDVTMPGGAVNLDR